MSKLGGMFALNSGVAASAVLLMLAGCGSSKTTAADTIPVPTVTAATTASTLPAPTVPIATVPPTTQPPALSLGDSYQSDMVALVSSPAWAIIVAQVGPENSYQTNFSGNAPTVPDAQLSTVTAEIHNVDAELNALAQNDLSNSSFSSSHLDADNEIQAIAIDLSSIPNDLSSGIGIPGDINSIHKDDVQVRTLLQLSLTGPGYIGTVPNSGP